MKLKKRIKISKESGFSMIEGMIAVLIIGVLAIIAVPRIVPTDKKLLYATARQITSDMRYARGLAVAKTQEHAVTFKLKDGLTQYEVVISNSSGSIKTLDLPEIVVLYDPDNNIIASPLTIAFTLFGSSTSDGEVLKLKIGSYQYIINVVGTTGRVWEEET